MNQLAIACSAAAAVLAGCASTVTTNTTAAGPGPATVNAPTALAARAEPDDHLLLIETWTIRPYDAETLAGDPDPLSEAVAPHLDRLERILLGLELLARQGGIVQRSLLRVRVPTAEDPVGPTDP